MLPPAGLEVSLVPVETDDVHQEALGQAMLADHALGQGGASRGEGDLPAGPGDQIVRFQPLKHLRHRGSRFVQAFGKAGLDDGYTLFQ